MSTSPARPPARTSVRTPLCTRASLADDLADLGIRPGETLLVHSSLSALGWVCGGPVAVTQALLDALGPEGTLTVPTHSADYSDPSEWRHPPVPEEWWPEIRATMPAYDPRAAPTWGIGVLPETVRTWPGALRSAHPQTSFAAIGPGAAEIVQGHALDCRLGERSPLARLEEAGARVLLLGTGFGACTAFHLAEYRVPSPVVDNSFPAMTPEGRKWLTVRDTDIDETGFEELGAAYEHECEGEMVRGRVGGAESRLFPLAGAVGYAERWLGRYRGLGRSGV